MDNPNTMSVETALQNRDELTLWARRAGRNLRARFGIEGPAAVADVERLEAEVFSEEARAIVVDVLREEGMEQDARARAVLAGVHLYRSRLGHLVREEPGGEPEGELWSTLGQAFARGFCYPAAET